MATCALCAVARYRNTAQFARVTNTGVTTFINAKGEMAETLPIFTPAVLKTQLEILEGKRSMCASAIRSLGGSR